MSKFLIYYCPIENGQTFDICCTTIVEAENAEQAELQFCKVNKNALVESVRLINDCITYPR